MANTELPEPELPGVMRVTPAGVTLEVVGGPTQEPPFYSNSTCVRLPFLVYVDNSLSCSANHFQGYG